MNRLHLTLSLLLPLCLLIGACGGHAIGCDYRETKHRCQERTGIQAANPYAFEGICKAAQGTYLGDGCPTTDRVGGCKVDGSNDVIDWYYAPETAETVQSGKCGDDPFVAAN